MIAMNTDDFKRGPSESAETDPEWNALRYVLGEMSADEVETFETILAIDQDVRELVAQSTGLVTNLLETAAEPVSTVKPTDSTVQVRPARPARSVSAPRSRSRAGRLLVWSRSCAVVWPRTVSASAPRVGPSLDEISVGAISEGKVRACL